MQRELKFRIWDTKGLMFSQFGEGRRSNGNKLYLDYHLIHPEGCGTVLFDENGVYFPEEGRYVIQQFTGLLDKNNKEIYEGDVVKTDPDHFVAKLQARRESEEYTEYTRGQVRWVNEGFMVCQEHIGATRISEYSACDCCPCGLEIIGNIFENPELLLGV